MRQARVVVLDEALRDLLARWLLTTLVVVVAAAAGASTVLLVASDVDRVREVWDAQVAEGRFVHEVTGVQGAGVDAASCAAVGAWEGVRAAGGRTATTPVRLVTAPASRYDVAAVTPGYVAVVWPGTAAPLAGEVLVGPHAAGSTGLRPGDVAVWADTSGVAGSARVTVVPADGTPRDPTADRQLLTVVPATGTVDRCLVDVDPDHAAAVLPALSSWFEGVAGSPRPVVDLTRAVDPQSALAARASGRWWALAAGLAVATAAASWSARRADLALLRLLGADSGVLALRLAAESVVLVLGPALAGVAAGVVVAAPALGHAVVRDVVLLDVTRLLAVLAALPLLGLALVGRGSVFRVLKES